MTGCHRGNPPKDQEVPKSFSNYIILPDPPVVSLTLGSKLDASDIKEGDDVYFECKIKSHPKVQKVTWKKDVRCLFNT